MRLLIALMALLVAAACVRPASNDLVSHAASSPPTERTNLAASSPDTTPPQASAPAAPPRRLIPPPDALTDSAITRRIGGELAADPGMAGADVSVNTDRGVVTLSGTVKSQEQTGIASAHAQRQDGVMRVDNHLRPVLS
jgi:hypothetical protein